MESIEYLKLLGLVIATLTPIWGVIIWIVKLQLASELKSDIDHIKIALDDYNLKLKVVWEWMMRSAMPQALDKGLLTQNSPIKPTNLSLSLFGPVLKELQEYYQTVKDKDQHEIEILFAEKFGSWIVDNIHNIEKGACLKTAITIAKGIQ